MALKVWLVRHQRMALPLGVGLFMALGYSAWVSVLALAAGPESFAREVGVTLPALVGMYFFGGIMGGLIVGLLLPLTRWLIRAVFIGYVAALPFFSLCVLTLVPPEDWYPKGVSVTLVTGLLGAFVAAGLWSQEFGKRS